MESQASESWYNHQQQQMVQQPDQQHGGQHQQPQGENGQQQTQNGDQSQQELSEAYFKGQTNAYLSAQMQGAYQAAGIGHG